MCSTTPSNAPATNGVALCMNEGRLNAFLHSIPAWWAICLAWAGIIAWDSRHFVNPDGLSYLDLASEALIGGPSKLVNGCWSPAYPALLSIALWIFHPLPSQEFPLIQLVNFFIFVLALWAFSSFLRYWLLQMRQIEPASYRIERHLIPFAFCTFLWFTLEFGGAKLITPDLGVAAIVFCTSAICCRLSLPGSTWKHYGALGLALAAGYYMKNAMLPLGLGLLGVLVVVPPRRVKRQKLLLSAIVFLLLSAPLIAMLSSLAGRLTYGETGRLNYLWDVNRVPDIGWTGDSLSPHGTPEHPPRKLSQIPLTIEFASPVSGTYPLWDDPSYWYAGATLRFDLRQQLTALKKTLQSYEAILLQTAAFAAGAVVLFLWCLHEKLPITMPREIWWQLAWPVAACSMYALVHVDHRYVSPFLVFLWLTIYGVLTLRLKGQCTWPILATCICTAMLTFTANPLTAGARVMRDCIRPRRSEDYELAADRLRNLGLHSGDRLALVGSAFSPAQAYPYYARIDRLRVVAQVPDENEFWRLSAPELELLEERLASIGVKAIVAINRPDYVSRLNWSDVTLDRGVQFNILLLSGLGRTVTNPGSSLGSVGQSQQTEVYVAQ
jgi:hypothetical protein